MQIRGEKRVGVGEGRGGVSGGGARRGRTGGRKQSEEAAEIVNKSPEPRYFKI